MGHSELLTVQEGEVFWRLDRGRNTPGHGTRACTLAYLADVRSRQTKLGTVQRLVAMGDLPEGLCNRFGMALFRVERELLWRRAARAGELENVDGDACNQEVGHLLSDERPLETHEK